MVMNHLPGTSDDPPSIWSSPNLNPEKKICQSNSHLCLSTKLTSAGQNSQLEGGPKQPNQTTLGLNIWPNGIRFHQPSGFPEIRRFPLQSPPFGREIIGPEICCLLKWLFRNRLRLRGAFFTGTRPYNGRVRALSSLNWRWIWDFGRAYRYAYIYMMKIPALPFFYISWMMNIWCKNHRWIKWHFPKLKHGTRKVSGVSACHKNKNWAEVIV